VTTLLEPETDEVPPEQGPRRRRGQSRRQLEHAVGIARADNAAGRAGRLIALGVAFLVAVQLTFNLSLPYFVDGVVLGSLYGIIAVALILIYRTNRIINFAVGAIGAVPAIFALVLDAHNGIPYLAVLPIALVGGPLCGIIIDVLVMRRFARSPRLIVTVVTIGVAQGLAIIGFFTPIWLGVKANLPPNVPTPWSNSVLWRSGRGQPILTGNQVAAIVTVVVLATALALFLRYTRIGIAIRASAENADRASLLGIPVLLVGTVAWAAAGLLSAMAIYVQAPLIGLPQNVTLGFDTLLYALAAAVVARMERIGLSLVAGMGVGIIIFGSVAKTGDNNLASAIMVIVILVALLAQKGVITRALDTGTSTWEAVKQFRPVPLELRRMREVVVAKGLLLAVVTALAVGAPYLVKQPDLPQLAFLPIYGIVAISLVVLTGWAGQISLGQFALVGAGALAAGGLIADHNIDFFAALAIGIAAGVLVAVIIGLPAVRIQGLYLAVTTLAFGYAMQGYLINKNYWIGRHLLPKGLTAHLERPLLYGRIDLNNGRSFYYVCLVFLLLAMLAAYAFRRNRSGRILIAARDNQRAAPAYSINLVRTRLAAFAVSGGMAGLAGVLIAYSQHNVVSSSYSVFESIGVFLATVIGGLTSVGFAVAGAITFEFLRLFGPRYYHFLGKNVITIIPLLVTGPLLVLNLYFYPGGSAEAGFQERDKFLRRVAAKHNLLVPSLVADRRVEEEQEQQADLIVRAEQHVEEVEAIAEAAIACPVCGEMLSLEQAAEHEHLRPPANGDTGSKPARSLGS
jgi:branched-subunit amino acid ABC-type transport system permease component